MGDDMLHAIGMDIGVTNVKAVCVLADGSVIARESFATQAERADWPDRVRGGLARIEACYGRAMHVGLAAPGVAAPDGSKITWMRGRLDEVEGLRWSDFLSRPAPILNDAQAALLGEVWQGAARGAKHAIMLTLGTGVGGAAMVDGQLLKGHRGRAGHLGHITVNMDGPPDIVGTPSSLEMHIGNYSISQRSAGAYATTHDLIDAVLAGNGAASAIWRRSVQALAAAIASLVNVLDPEVVIIGGGIAAAGDVLLTPLKAMLQPMEWKLEEAGGVRIALAELGEYAGALGAAWNAMKGESDF